MAGIPGVKPIRFYQKKGYIELFGSIPPIILTIITTIVYLTDPTKIIYGFLSLLAFIWVIIAAVTKVLHGRSQDEEKRMQNSYLGELGAIYVLYNIVERYQINLQEASSMNLPQRWLRVTIHRVVYPKDESKPAEEFEQLLRYVGGGEEDGKAGRRFSVRSGIVGRTIREKDAFAASRNNDDYDKYIQELIHDWAYTEHDARSVEYKRQSWMAVPIFGSGNRVIAVVYLDTIIRNFFTDEVKQLVLNASYGITSFINERYGSS